MHKAHPSAAIFGIKGFLNINTAFQNMHIMQFLCIMINYLNLRRISDSPDMRRPTSKYQYALTLSSGARHSLPRRPLLLLIRPHSLPKRPIFFFAPIEPYRIHAAHLPIHRFLTPHIGDNPVPETDLRSFIPCSRITYVDITKKNIRFIPACQIPDRLISIEHDLLPIRNRLKQRQLSMIILIIHIDVYFNR